MFKQLEINKLCIGYRQGKAVKRIAAGLAAAINASELVCLLGPNGVGKSTLMRTICGFQPYFEGEIRIGERLISGLDDRIMARLVSVVLTDRLTIANASVQELVGYGRSPHTGLLGKIRLNDRRIIQQSMEQCGIAHKAHELLTNLSDGERQKAFIAKALAQDTPLLLLDEPTAFLDLPSRVEVMRLLREIARQAGKSVLLSTHDLELALQMADQLWLMQNGTIVTGGPEDLLLQNAFQPMFEKNGIRFDNKTGVFQVTHPEMINLKVKGHGVGYVLLRRAFAREGIRLDPFAEEDNCLVVVNTDGSLFSFRYLEDEIFELSSVAQFVAQTKRYLKHRGILVSKAASILKSNI